MSKRQTAARFRERLALLLEQSGLSQTAFAGAIGIDRSALSQLLSGALPRLPRA
jgi:transcriptional regulator with XRE-family HTH domain